MTYEIVEKNTFFLILELYSVVNCSKENPVMNVKYPGIRGKMQGDENEISPAIKAAGYEIDSANILINWHHKI